jgi:hypothetical protein
MEHRRKSRFCFPASRTSTQQMKNMPSGVRRRDGGGQPLRADPVYSYDRLVLDVEWKSLVVR